MRKWRWLIFICFLTQKTFCSASIFADTVLLKNDAASAADIDNINTVAYDTFLTDPAGARKLAEKALLKSKTASYAKGTGQSFLNIGASYWAQSYHQLSLLYLDTALQYFESTDHVDLSICYRHIARNYIDLKDYSAANTFLNKAEFEAGANSFLLEEVIAERSLIFSRKQQFDLAINEVNKALKITKQINKTASQSILYGRLCGIYSDNTDHKNYGLALAYADSAIILSYVTKNKRLRASCWVTKANVLLNERKPDEGLVFANSALLLADSLGLADIESGAYLSIIRIYESKGDMKNQMAYQNRYIAFEQNLSKANQQNSSQIIADYFALNDKLRNIDQANHKGDVYNLIVKSQKKIIVILSLSLLLLMVALYIVYRYYRQKRILAQTLNEQNMATIAQSQLIEVQAQHLEELNNLKNKLLLVIGHDLRGPIGNLSSLTGMFEDGHLKEEEVKEVMRSIGPVVRGAELTLKNLLEWAESQIKGNNLEATYVNLAPIVEEIESIFKYSFDQKNITFSNQVLPEHIVLMDLNHLKVILRNLISNAIKFTPAKGRVTVTSHINDGKITVGISDTGRGMNNEEIERLLSVKTHFTKPGTQGEKGTGIGLLLCRELIELNGGEMWLTSEVDKGTTFYFSLPSR